MSARVRITELERDRDGKRVWFVDIDLGRRPDGSRNRVRFTVHGKRSEADQRAADIVSGARKGVYIGLEARLSSLIDAWLEEYVKVKLGRRTYEHHSPICETLKERMGYLPIAELRQSHVNDYAEDLKLTDAGKLRHYKVLSACLHWCAEQGHCAHEVPARLIRPRHEKKEPIIVAPDEALDLIRLSRDQRTEETKDRRHGRPNLLYIPGMLAVTAGLRRGEVAALRWEDVDFPHRLIHVRWRIELADGEMQRLRPKGNKIRSVPMTDLLDEALEEHRAKQDEHRLLLGSEWEQNELVSPTFYGMQRRPDVLSSQWSKFARAHDYVGLSFHGLRHSFASICIAAGYDLVTVADWMGHSDPSTTARIYAHQFAAARRKRAEKLDDVWNLAAKRVRFEEDGKERGSVVAMRRRPQ